MVVSISSLAISMLSPKTIPIDRKISPFVGLIQAAARRKSE
jgi:hypothetical protein